MFPIPNYYLILSSSFFSIPALYGFLRGHRVLPMLSILAAGTSIRYWTNPSNESFLRADQLISRTTGLIYTIYGIWTIEAPQTKMIFCLDIVLMLSSYHSSCLLYNSPYHELWIPVHMMFHYYCTLSQLIVL